MSELLLPVPLIEAPPVVGAPVSVFPDSPPPIVVDVAEPEPAAVSSEGPSSPAQPNSPRPRTIGATISAITEPDRPSDAPQCGQDDSDFRT